jgi:hypothetical protein
MVLSRQEAMIRLHANMTLFYMNMHGLGYPRGLRADSQSARNVIFHTSFLFHQLQMLGLILKPTIPFRERDRQKKHQVKKFSSLFSTFNARYVYLIRFISFGLPQKDQV